MSYGAGYGAGRGVSMGRGRPDYGPPGGGANQYYPPHGGGGGPPLRHGQPGAYMAQGDYESPPIARDIRGGGGYDYDAPQGPRYDGGGFGRGYSAGRGAPGPPHGTGGPPYPRGADQESSTRFEPSSSTDAHANDGKSFANDCEIVVLTKAQQQYGEMVEMELRKKGLKVDIMFPKGEVKVQEFLKPIARLGTIFAVVIDGESEQRRMINFYQFRGHVKPQLHKNVPIPMAYDLIFKKYMELKVKEIGVVPDATKKLLSKLMNEETLGDHEYTALVRFCQERRKRQNAFLNRTSNVVADHKADIESLVDTEEGRELQKRVLSIMNENAA